MKEEARRGSGQSGGRELAASRSGIRRKLYLVGLGEESELKQVLQRSRREGE